MILALSEQLKSTSCDRVNSIPALDKATDSSHNAVLVSYIRKIAEKMRET